MTDLLRMLPGHVPTEVVSTASFYAHEPDTSRPVWALTSLSFHQTTAGLYFRRGDRVERDLPADVLRAVVARGDASYERPDDVSPIFAVERVEHREHLQVLAFGPGRRIDGCGVPDAVIAEWLKNGQATTEEPA
jgi:hypothetical protein